MLKNNKKNAHFVVKKGQSEGSIFFNLTVVGTARFGVKKTTPLREITTKSSVKLIT